MKTPDKICVAPHQISDYDLDIQEVGHNGAEEYIHKEALLKKLEKAAASYKKRSDEGELVWQNMCGINEAIDILNKM